MDDNKDWLKLISLIILGIIGIILQGYVFKILWDWYVVLWFGFKSLTIPIALGLILICRMATADLLVKRDDSMDYLTKVSVGIFFPLFSLIFGYIIKLFI